MKIIKKSFKKILNKSINSNKKVFISFIGKNEFKTKKGIVIIRDKNLWKNVDVATIGNNFTILELNELYNILNIKHNCYINNKDRLIRVITDFIDSKYRKEGFSSINNCNSYS